MIIICGRGELFIKYFSATEEAPYLEYLSQHSTTYSHTWASLMPKRTVDCTVNEIMRVVRLCIDKIEYVQFIIPRKVNFEYITCLLN
jgi:hypothetical protein